MVIFHCDYTNTNAKTIRYINVYFKVLNDVDDVLLVGNFKGVGPLKKWESTSWDWDSSSYFVSGDASRMTLTKVILTYMDGTQKVLTGNMIKCN